MVLSLKTVAVLRGPVGVYPIDNQTVLKNAYGVLMALSLDTVDVFRCPFWFSSSWLHLMRRFGFKPWARSSATMSA